MKRFLTYLASILIGSSAALGIALATQSEKVTICHATSSEENPWVRIVVSENAIGGHFENPGTPKAGHEDDILLEGEQDCPQPEENGDDSNGSDETNNGTGGGQADPENNEADNHPSTLPQVGANGV